MHKFVGLVLASTLLSNSVLVPLVANAQTVPSSVSTSSVTVESMTTAQVSSVQEPASATPPSLLPTNIFSVGVPSTTADSSLPASSASVSDLLPASILTPATYSVTLTSYNAVADQTSPTPWITASGAHTNPEVIAARSHGLASQLPFGTIIAIMGPSSADDGPYCGYSSVSRLIGYRVIADTTNARFIAPRIDVQLDQNEKVNIGGKLINPSVALGACTGVQIQVVGYVSPQHIPQTQAALAALVNNSQHLAFAKF